VFDPHADKVETRNEYGISLIDEIQRKYDGIVIAVAHKEFLKLDLKNFKGNNSVIFDLKSIFERSIVDARL